MDQNQTADNQILNDQSVDNELQKAIDNITNNTNADPVFSDPVAAPSSIPEGDTGELDESIGPFPTPEPLPNPPATANPEPASPTPEPTPEAASFNQNTAPGLAPNPFSAPEPTPAPELTPPPAPEVPTIEQPMPEITPQSLDTNEVKKAALRDLIPILDKTNMEASEKFHVYRDIFDDLKDYTVLAPAYQVARNIPDETERAEALLYLIKAIDQM